MKRSSKSKQWAAKHSKDPFVKKSLRDKYRSRAAYKLQEINDKYKVLSNVHSVVDLGCAPGSWLQLINNFNKSMPSLSVLSNLISIIAKSGIFLLISKTACS